MRAQILTAYTGPDGLALQEASAPVLERDTDVRIRIEACGACHRDITYSRGKFSGGQLPTILGHEGVGTILEIGSAVPELVPGDRVVNLQFATCGECAACRSEWPQHCPEVRGVIGETRAGLYAEEVVLPYWVLGKVPADLPAPEAAVTACTLGTAYHALHRGGFTPDGKVVAINGAGGGVGLHTIQVAKALGARVIAVTSSEHKRTAIQRAGADEVVVSADGQYRKAVQRLAGGEGVDLFLDIVGAPTMPQSLRAVRRGGAVVAVGNPQGEAFEFNPGLIIVKEITVYGTLGMNLRELEVVLDMVRAGILHPIVEEVLPLDRLPEAFRRMEARQVTGRLVVVP